MDWNKINTGNAIDGIRKLESDSIDCILIDPPYNIGIDFGNNKTKKETREYVDWCAEWIHESERVLHPQGTMFVYGFSEILAYLSIEMDIDHRWLIWHYTNKTVPSLNFWQRSHESILCGWKSKESRIFNRDSVREPYTEGFVKGYKGKDRKRPNTKGRFDSGKETSYTVNELGALPRDVIKISTLAGGAGAKERIGWCKDCNTSFFGLEYKKHKEHNHFKHPTQKPLDLTRKLFASCMPEDRSGKILIPFAGTGSECAVAKEMGHQFIAFDLNKEYAIMANDFVGKY